MILLTFLVFLAGCEKDQKPDPVKPVESLVNWSWNADLSNTQNELYSNPVLYNNWVIVSYISDYLGRNLPALTAFDKKTGDKVWEYVYPYKTTEKLRNLKVYKDNIIILYTDRIVCLNLLSRQIVWEQLFDVQERISHPMDVYGDYLYKSVEYYDDVSDYPFNDSITLFRYHIPTGTKEKLYGERRIDSSDKHPVIYPCTHQVFGEKELVFFTVEYLDQGELHPIDFVAVNVKTKEIEWRKIGFSPIRTAWNTPPLVSSNQVSVAGDWSIYSWNIENAQLNWQTVLQGLNQKAGFSFSGPFLHDGKIFAISNEGKVFCLDASSGTLLWQNVKVGVNDNGPARGPCNRPIVVGDILFVNTWSDQALVLIDTKEGKQIERHTDAKYNGRNVLYDEETETFFVTADEKLRAFTIIK